MVRIILVRHGQTQWNVERRFRGRTDVKLDQTGIRQAKATAKRLNHLKLNAIYSSPLGRAFDTARIIAQARKFKVEPVEGFIDIDFGGWQGLSLEEVEVQYLSLYQLWLSSPQKVRFPGGEGLDEVRERAVAALNGLLDRHKNGTVLVVTHRVVNKVLICAILGLDNSHFWQIRQDTGAMNIFEYRNRFIPLETPKECCSHIVPRMGFIVVRLNDTSHLGDDRTDVDF